MAEKPKPVIAQEWEESERGWGVRPDGLSLHLNDHDRVQFIKRQQERQRRYFEELGITDTPDEYTRPRGAGAIIDVNARIYADVRKHQYGCHTKYQSIAHAGDLSKPEAGI